jgi:hypothetical protein
MDLHHMKLLTIRHDPLLCLRMTLHQDITNKQYLMEDIKSLPDITGLILEIKPNGHSFGASVFHVLRMCTGLRDMRLTLMGVRLSFLYLSHSCYAFIFLGSPTFDLLSSHTLGVGLILDALLQNICMEKIYMAYVSGNHNVCYSSCWELGKVFHSLNMASLLEMRKITRQCMGIFFQQWNGIPPSFCLLFFKIVLRWPLSLEGGALLWLLGCGTGRQGRKWCNCKTTGLPAAITDGGRGSGAGMVKRQRLPEGSCGRERDWQWVRGGTILTGSCCVGSSY